MTPRISLVSYADRQPGFIFVAVPNERGRYLRTDASVAAVECPMCEAMIGEPCKGAAGMVVRYSATTHAIRRKLAGRAAERPDDILSIEPEEGGAA